MWYPCNPQTSQEVAAKTPFLPVRYSLASTRKAATLSLGCTGTFLLFAGYAADKCQQPIPHHDNLVIISNRHKRHTMCDQGTPSAQTKNPVSRPQRRLRPMLLKDTTMTAMKSNTFSSPPETPWAIKSFVMSIMLGSLGTPPPPVPSERCK